MKNLLIAFWLISSLSQLQAAYSIGETPPDFGCNDTYGNYWSLYDQRGKVVLINFGATW